MLPLIETAANPAPQGGAAIKIRTADGIALRCAAWRPQGRVHGTAVLLNGRTEYIEKYFETAGDLLARGFGVITIDWRGQGGSQRLLPERLKGHVRDFAEYGRDLATAIEAAKAREMQAPFILLAHSMGAVIGLSFLHDAPDVFACAVLSAPMLDIKTPMPGFLARGIARAGVMLGGSEAYVPGGAGPRPEEEKFEGNPVTSDRARFERNMGVLKANPKLGVARPTLGWVDAAYRAMARINASEFCAGVETPLLLASAGNDRIVNPGADLRLVQRLKHGVFVAFGDSEHEILQERDDVRTEFFAAFDAFVALHIPGYRAA